jgi:uncharacterized protein with FMN-binding domain
MPEGDSNNGSTKKVANGLVAASCAAVLTVYTAGYVRTKSAVDRFEAQAAERRAALPESKRIVGRVDGPRSAMRTEPATERSSRHFPARDDTSAPKRITPALPPPPEFKPPDPSEAGEPIALDVSRLPLASAPSSDAALPTQPPAPTADAKVETVAPEPSAPKWKDGTYLGWGTSRHGNIQAEVVIEQGRIASAIIAQCRTRYSCSVIEQLPPQVAQRQSPDVDYVSGATQSADAFYFAVVDALDKAK